MCVLLLGGWRETNARLKACRTRVDRCGALLSASWRWWSVGRSVGWSAEKVVLLALEKFVINLRLINVCALLALDWA